MIKKLLITSLFFLSVCFISCNTGSVDEMIDDYNSVFSGETE